MRFNGPVIYPHHLQEMLKRLIGLLIKQKIQALQVIDIQRRRPGYYAGADCVMSEGTVSFGGTSSTLKFSISLNAAKASISPQPNS